MGAPAVTSGIALLLAAGCLLGTEPDFGNSPVHWVENTAALSLSARTDFHENKVRVRIFATNQGTAPAELSMGWCSWVVRFVGLRHTWDNRIPPGAACPDVGIIMLVDPGQTRERVILWTPPEEIRQLRSPGPYGVVVYYRDRHSSELRKVPAGGITF